MVVIHSGLTRKLSDGRYKARKEECDAAREAFGEDAICLLDPETIASADAIDERADDFNWVEDECTNELSMDIRALLTAKSRRLSQIHRNIR